ncbi:hypothetical protein I6M49_21695 [Shewanella algae]|uniref:hypothetical protein n=1 Tax=Shewanella algae TaxID=38313 RepID=UPI001AACD18A|nr:hypothetical protein [Shewanella algae]MBO2656061.1 hypothetical protein [Shewanella algae]
MYQIDTAGAVAEMPEMSAGDAPGWFHEGGGGKRPTKVGAQYFNMLQAELLGVLSAAGIAPDATKQDLTQIAQTIAVIAGGAASSGRRDHLAAPNPHPQYLSGTELDDAMTAHNADPGAHSAAVLQAVANALRVRMLSAADNGATLSAGEYAAAIEDQVTLKLPTAQDGDTIRLHLNMTGAAPALVLHSDTDTVAGEDNFRVGIEAQGRTVTARFVGDNWRLSLTAEQQDLTAWAANITVFTDPIHSQAVRTVHSHCARRHDDRADR